MNDLSSVSANIIVEIIKWFVPILLSYIAAKLGKRYSKLLLNRIFYPLDTVNAMIKNYDFSNSMKNEFLNSSRMEDYYEEGDYKKVTLSVDGNQKEIKLPYKEEIDFIKSPESKIVIASQEITHKFKLSDDINELTNDAFEEFRSKRMCENDPHPRLASLEKVGDDQYKCTIEEASYFQQARTNLIMDYLLEKRATTMRDIDYAQQNELPDLSKSILANTIGVSAIWVMGNGSNRRVFMLPRKKKVGVFESSFGIPSGSVEMPTGNHFPTDSLVEFLTSEIKREFTEETGIKKMDEFEFIPLACVRELLRGGKPQFFFLIRSKEFSTFKLVFRFLTSKGIKEFEGINPVTKAIPSLETACNYLYALKYLYRNSNDVISL